MKNILIAIAILITLMVTPAYGVSNVDNQSEFLNTMTSYISEYNEIFTDMTENPNNLNRYIDDLEELLEDISSESPPIPNYPYYDVIQYSLINAIDSTITAIETDSGDTLIEAAQYLLIVSIICETIAETPDTYLVY